MLRAQSEALVLLLNFSSEVVNSVSQLQLQVADSTKKVITELQQRSWRDGQILCYVQDGKNAVAKTIEIQKLAGAFFNEFIKPRMYQMSWMFLFDDILYSIMDKW